MDDPVNEPHLPPPDGAKNTAFKRDSQPANSTSWRTNPWVVCLLPFLVFMLAGSFEPGPPAEHSSKPKAVSEVAPAEQKGETAWGINIQYRSYPLVYTIKIALVFASILFVLPGYRQMAPELGRWRISLLAVGIGVVGIVVWVALAMLQRWAMSRMGWQMSIGSRSGFDPLLEMPDRAQAFGFLAVRFFGLAILVPVLEEFFLRGFVMRYTVEANWWRVSLGQMTRLAIVVGTAVPVLLHPGEAVAAAVWFSGITWLMLRTRNIWDCVVAHAVTNLLLGVWVVAANQWWLM